MITQKYGALDKLLQKKLDYSDTEKVLKDKYIKLQQNLFYGTF